MYICRPNITNTTMKMDFPQVDLPTEVLAWTNVTEDILNITSNLAGCKHVLLPSVPKVQ